jgi:hypothetical protein
VSLKVYSSFVCLLSGFKEPPPTTAPFLIQIQHAFELDNTNIILRIGIGSVSNHQKKLHHNHPHAPNE